MLIVYKVKYYMCLYTFKSAYLLNKRVKSIKKINIYNNYLNINNNIKYLKKKL